MPERHVPMLRGDEVRQHVHPHAERPQQLWGLRERLLRRCRSTALQCRGVWGQLHVAARCLRKRVRRHDHRPAQLRSLRHAMPRWRQLRERRLYLRSGALAVRLDLRGYAERQRKLRGVRQALRAGDDVHRGSVRRRLRVKPHPVHGHGPERNDDLDVHRSLDQREKLRHLRYGLPDGRSVHQRDVRLPERRDAVRRRIRRFGLVRGPDVEQRQLRHVWRRLRRKRAAVLTGHVRHSVPCPDQ